MSTINSSSNTLNSFIKLCRKMLKESSSSQLFTDHLTSFDKKYNDKRLEDGKRKEIMEKCIKGFVMRNKTHLIKNIFDGDNLNDDWLKSPNAKITFGDGIIQSTKLKASKSVIDINNIYQAVCNLCSAKEKECGDDEEKRGECLQLVYPELFIYRLFCLCNEYCLDNEIKDKLKVNIDVLNIYLVEGYDDEDNDNSSPLGGIESMFQGEGLKSMFSEVMKHMGGSMDPNAKNEMEKMIGQVDIAGIMKKITNKLPKDNKNLDFSTIGGIAQELMQNLTPYFPTPPSSITDNESNVIDNQIVNNN